MVEPLKFPIPVTYIRRFFKAKSKDSRWGKWHIRPMQDREDDHRVLEGLCGFQADTLFTPVRKHRTIESKDECCTRCWNKALKTDHRGRYAGETPRDVGIDGKPITLDHFTEKATIALIREARDAGMLDDILPTDRTMTLDHFTEKATAHDAPV